jgi:hypothetical protein
MEAPFLTVEDTFDITDRGLIVVPGPLETECEGPARFPVLLERPDGKRLKAELTLEHLFQSPPPKEVRWVCLLSGMSKADVPVGTAIYRTEGER